MQQPVRVGIVGCGFIAQVHAWKYETLGAQVAWVYDPSPAAIEQYGKRRSFRTAGSVEELADRNKVDVVSVCSPPRFHPDNVMPLIDAGIPTLCEKPLAADVRGSEQIAAAVRARRDLVFMVGFCHRFEPRVAELGRIVRSGRLGRPILLRNSFAQHGDMRGNSNASRKLAGGGAMTGNGAHSIDLFRWLIGEPTRVQAMAATVAQDLDTEDLGLMQLSMDDKAFGDILSSFSTHFARYTLEVYGTQGTVLVDYAEYLPAICRYRLAGDAEWTVVPCPDHPDVFESELAHFLECARTGAAPSITADDGLAASRVLDAAYRSARDGCSVKITPEPGPPPVDTGVGMA